VGFQKNERKGSTKKFKCYNFHKLHLKQFLFSFDNDSFAQMFPDSWSVTKDTTPAFQKDSLSFAVVLLSCQQKSSGAQII
jgi:hypothetical protein